MRVTEGGDGLGDAHGEVGMAEVQTDADLIEVAHLEDGEQVARGWWGRC
jgi:hypothetical protein